MVKFLAKFPQVRKQRKSQAFYISVWGNMGDDIIKYYNVGDFILVEGFLSINDQLLQSKDKQVELTVLKIFPYFVSEMESNYSKVSNLNSFLPNKTDIPF